MSKERNVDFERVSWEEYGSRMEKIYKEVDRYRKEKDIQIDAIVPIYRGAATLGSYLAYRLSLLRILPVQYKYFFPTNHKAELKQILFTPKADMFDHDPVFLLVEGDQCYGNTVIAAAKDLKKVFPNCRILHAADCLDYTYRESAKDYVDVIFYGAYTNHCEELSEKECEKLGIGGQTVAPWENLDEEQATISGQQYQYLDLESVRDQAVKKAEFEF